MPTGGGVSGLGGDGVWIQVLSWWGAQVDGHVRNNKGLSGVCKGKGESKMKEMIEKEYIVLDARRTQRIPKARMANGDCTAWTYLCGEYPDCKHCEIIGIYVRLKDR